MKDIYLCKNKYENMFISDDRKSFVKINNGRRYTEDEVNRNKSGVAPFCKYVKVEPDGKLVDA